MRTESNGASDFPWLPPQGVPAVRVAFVVVDRPTLLDPRPHARLHPLLPVLHGRAYASRIRMVLIQPARWTLRRAVRLVHEILTAHTRLSGQPKAMPCVSLP
jgi:hypothetical protein